MDQQETILAHLTYLQSRLQVLEELVVTQQHLDIEGLLMMTDLTQESAMMLNHIGLTLKAEYRQSTKRE